MSIECSDRQAIFGSISRRENHPVSSSPDTREQAIDYTVSRPTASS